jgi:tripartite ATP-independent transporter DctP family solute receptor
MSLLARWCGFGILAAVVLMAGGCGKPTTQTLRLSHITNPDSPWDKGARKFAELVAARSGGRLEVQVYPGAQLAQNNQKTELQQLCGGTIDMTLHSPIILALFLDKRFDAFSLPWLFPDLDTASRVCDGPFGQRALGWLEEHDVHGIAYGANGFRQLTNSVRPVRTPEDLAGMKVRVAGTDLFRAVFAAFGANPTTMNFGEVFTALQQGAISAQENPLSIIDSSKLYEVQKHLTLWNYAYDPLILTCNRQVWNRLSPADRELLEQCGKEAMAYQRQVVADDDARLVRELTQHGMEVVTLTGEEIARFRERCQGVYAEFAPRIGADVVKQVQDAVRDAQ